MSHILCIYHLVMMLGGSSCIGRGHTATHVIYQVACKCGDLICSMCSVECAWLSCACHACAHSGFSRNSSVPWSLSLQKQFSMHSRFPHPTRCATVAPTAGGRTSKSTYKKCVLIVWTNVNHALTMLTELACVWFYFCFGLFTRDLILELLFSEFFNSLWRWTSLFNINCWNIK